MLRRVSRRRLNVLALGLLATTGFACGGEAPPPATLAPPPPPADAGVSAAPASTPDPDDALGAAEMTPPPGAPRIEAFDDGSFFRATWSPDGRFLALTEAHAIVVTEGGAVRLRIPVDMHSPPVRFEGGALSVIGPKSIARYDVESGARLDDVPAQPPTRPPKGAGGVVARIPLDGGGTVEVARSATSTKKTIQKQVFFHDDTGMHPYDAPFDVVHSTVRYTVTRKTGAAVTRELFTGTCTNEFQQPQSIRRAPDAHPHPLGVSPPTPDLSTTADPCNLFRGIRVSPDGEVVAATHFVREKDSGHEAIAVVSLAHGHKDDLAAPERASTAQLVFGGGSKRLLWQLRNGQSVETRGYELTPSSSRKAWAVSTLPGALEASFSPDGSKIAFASEASAVVVDASNGAVAFSIGAHPAAALTAVAARPGAVAVGTETGGVHLLSPSGIARADAFAHDHVGGLVWSPSGATFAAHTSFLGAPPRESVIKLFDAAGKLGLTIPSPAEMTWEVAFSPDGARLVAATNEKDLLAWSIADGSGPTRLATSFTGGRATVAVSAKLIATSEGGQIALLARDTQSLVGSMKAPSGRVERMRFSADGATLYVIADKTLTAFDTATHAQRWTTPLGDGAPDPKDLAVSDDALLVTGYSMRTHLRSAVDGSLLLRLPGTDTNPHAAFLGRRIVVQEPHLVRVLTRKGVVLATVRFSPDGAGAVVESAGRTEVFGALPTWCVSGERVVPDSACEATRAKGLLAKVLGAAR